MLQQPEDWTVTEAKATERDTVAKVFPRMRSAISCPRAASRSEVTLNWGHSLGPPRSPRYLAGTRTGPPSRSGEGVSTSFTETHKTGTSPQVIPRLPQWDEGNQICEPREHYQRQMPRNSNPDPVTSQVRNSALQPGRKAKTAPASQHPPFATSQYAHAYLGWSGGNCIEKVPEQGESERGWEAGRGEMGKERKGIERTLFTCFYFCFCLSAGRSYRQLMKWTAGVPKPIRMSGCRKRRYFRDLPSA